MIHWTFAQNIFQHVQALLNETITCFSDEELEEFHKFTVPNRGMEWLFSRWTVKKLAAGTLGETDLRLIRIRKEPGGVPYVEVANQDRLGWLSFSHSHRGVLAALSTDGALRFGVDLEHLEPRSPGLLNDFFTAAEGAWVACLPENEQTLTANLIWSAKEAFLKALEKGLQLDTRRIEIQPCDLANGQSEWRRLEFRLDGKSMSGWHLCYRREEDFVLTMCLTASQEISRASLGKSTAIL